ncbi:MAG: BMP family ABC transporter substrate-binding protein [Clostridia bacterium]|nr:BMP family ABC transporter substrate-binding protein [Clostridia bacterium]
MKKVLSVILMLAMVFSLCIALASCNSEDNKPQESQNPDQSAAPVESESKEEGQDEELKFGFIYLHDQNSTYDRNFMDGAKAACEKLGVTYLEKVPIPEGNECYEAAADLVNQGCSLIFADSFGHEEFLIQAAEEFPDVEFCHATGTQAHTEELPNFHNAFASIYEGRYLAGIAAGMKLNEMIENGDFTAEEAKIGYVGAYTYAEVISGYTSFFLGARSVCPTATMEVQFTGSWYDETAEKTAAETLIQRGCKLISQHADSMGAPTACEDAGVPDISYNGSTAEACPNTFIVSSRINWEPYFEYIIDCVKNGKDIDTDWTGTLETESVVLTEVNEKAAAEGTVEAIEEAKAKLQNGEINVFDVSTFTVTVTEDKNVNATVDDEGHLTGYQADVDTDEAFQGDTEVVKDGAFLESEYRSAPYFDIQIDGIELLNAMF